MIVQRLLSGRILIAPILLVFSTNIAVFGQEDYRDGYIVSVKNDTLFGQVSNFRLGPFGGLNARIKFKGKGLKRKFVAKDLRGYKKGDSLYRSMLLNGKPEFLRLISEGAVSYYKYDFQEQGEQLVLDIDYLQKGNSPLIRATQGIFGLKRKRLASLFSDCPELVEKILNKEYDYVFEIVDFYNDWIARSYP